MNIEERFLKYVSFDTQSSPSSTTSPSTSKQKVLGAYLVEQLHDLGINNAHLDDFGIVYASIEANTTGKSKIGFLAHMDTSPDAPGNNIKPNTITNYDGNKILLNTELDIYLDPKDFPDLKEVIGHDIITTDGTTLLGADDKAGIAIIMDMASYIQSNPDFLHGKICIAFTPDEEVGRGVDNFDVTKFDADFAYTVDGGSIHEIGYENFNAYSAKVVFHGRSVHPGSAKNEMINSLKVAMEFDRLLPSNMTPETTEGYEGFYHLHDMQGDCEKTTLDYILRNHDLALLKKQIKDMQDIQAYFNTKYGYTICEIECHESYLNMYEVLKDNRQCIDLLMDACTRANIHAIPAPIRGGTDGARLTFMNLPCPNIGTGGYNFHGRFEYVSLTMMKQSSKLLLEILK